MKLWAIAINTFRENIRDRILYNLIVFAVLLIGLSVVLGELSFTEMERITTDAALFSFSVFGILIAVFLGIRLISKEIEHKTIYTLVAKPVPRYIFVFGRFLGLMITLALNLAIMTLAFVAVRFFILAGQGHELTWPIVQALLLIYVELAIITSVALVFSSMSSPTISAIFTLSFVVIGRLTAGLKDLAMDAESQLLKTGADVLYYAVPNLTNYVMIEGTLHGQGMAVTVFLETFLIGILTTAIFLVLAMAVFQRRDFV